MARRVLVLTVVILTALLLQLTVLSRLPLPGATPDLLLVIVVGVGLAFGPAGGAATGFTAGLLLDIVPPAAGVLGLDALLLAAIGYACGLLDDSDDRPVLVVLGTVATAGAAYILGTAALGSLVGDARVLWDDVPVLVLTEILYAVILATFVLPVLAALARRPEREPWP